MPWKVSGVVERRRQFVAEYESGQWTMSDLCRIYGITRPTGYELVRRWASEGEGGLEDRRRAPRRHPNQTPGEIEAQVLELRREHPRWGPRTLRAKLEQRQATVSWPAASTIGALLDREGLTVHRSKRRRVPPYTQPLAAATEPNRIWCTDFKGWFRTGDGTRIDALTMMDAHSRYLLRVQAVEKTDTARVQAIFEAAFRDYGLPRAIRSDNGAPFASQALAGLSRLSLWWMKLGIVAERIEPGHPEQNGMLERLHRTLQEETASPPEYSARAQQRAFDRFRRVYDEERPHQALAMRTPSALYQASPRPYPARVPQPEYGSAFKVRRVHKHGQFCWQHQSVFLSKVLYGEDIGLLPIDERYYRVYFADFPLAQFDSRELRIEPLSAEEQPGEQT
jgi:transposase InsO family protein